MARPRAKCGTDAAYRRHLRNHEPVDAACRDAHAANARQSNSAPGRKSVTPPPVTLAETQTGRDAPPETDGVGKVDDRRLILDTLRTAFVDIANSDPTKLAPIAREFRTAVETLQDPAEKPKELSLADQLAEARAARAARAQGQGATA